MESKSKVRKAVETVRQNVKEIVGDTQATVDELRAATHEVIPRPVRRRVEKRIADIRLGKRRRG